jgi:hypothetical protein
MSTRITNDGYLEVTVGLHALQNDCPRHHQNFQSGISLAGYEWYSSRLGTLRGSRFIEAFAAAADLLMQ